MSKATIAKVMAALWAVLICAVGSVPATGQAQRDRAAVTALTAAITNLGGVPPRDSVALASIKVTSGSSTEEGKMKITTRGMQQTSEEITLPSGTQSLIYSLGASNDRRGGAKPGEDPLSFELSLSAHSPIFPLPWLASHYANNDIEILNLGSEVLSGTSVVHLRLTNTFNSIPNQRHYSNFTVTDVWLDAKTSLPAKISYERRDAGGPVAPLPISYEYGDYRNVQGVLYPFQIHKFVNGTLWASITIQDVQLNTGVADAAFALR